MDHMPRLRSVTGVSRALIAVVGVPEAVRVLVAQFGWDVAFAALSHLDGTDGQRALYAAVAGLAPDATEEGPVS